ncbi:DUF2851 family protein [Rubritalea tangerina]|uniref:DUF2851 family protein n=1 Tax=Rubritalea tangerina TaxID=430798 RepID=UPI0036144074
MQSYSHLLRQSLATDFAKLPPLTFPDEITLQSLWFNGQIGREFTTTDNHSVHIRQFGFWNRSAGPTSFSASVEIDGHLHSGPLEIDTHACVWETHGHATNPSFNEVILHVVFADTAHTSFTRAEDHRSIPKVVIPTSTYMMRSSSPATQPQQPT